MYIVHSQYLIHLCKLKLCLTIKNLSTKFPIQNDISNSNLTQLMCVLKTFNFNNFTASHN